MEQTMMGMAAGMARMGFKPYVYTMRNFILLRPLEQVRNDICYGNANVKLFGVAGSSSYKFLGMSHNLAPGEEEVILSTLPNIKTYAPETEEECKEKIEEEYKREGPAYFAI
jgi:transketolase